MKHRGLRRTMLPIVIVAACLAGPSEAARAPSRGKGKPSDPLDGFAAFVEKARREWGVPGVAVAIVKDGAVVFQRGLGERDAEATLPITPDTVFPLASVTKSFTAASVALLVDDGKLDWDEPVRAWLPDFRLDDAWATERITPRDLLSHRSGLPRHDLVWYGANLPRDELVRRLRYLEPSADLRARFQYQNLMYMTAGYLVGERAGTTWESFVRERILKPLGMTRTSFSIAELERAAEPARPYKPRKGGGLERMPYRELSNLGPAGSMNSSLSDMAAWVRLHVGGGTFDGKRILSEPSLEEMHHPQTVMNDPPLDPEITNVSYGMGWFVESYRGHVRVQHGGNIDGFTTLVALHPRERFGVVVLANLDHSGLPQVVARTAADRLLDLPVIDWNGRMLERRKATEKSDDAAKAQADAERKPGTRPAHPPDDYVGEYEHPAYGILTVTRDGPSLAASLHGIPMRLEHWHYETFRALPGDPALADEKLFARFETNTKGDVDSVALPLEPAVAEIVFARRPPALLRDPAFLGKIAGEWVVADNPYVRVRLERQGPDRVQAIVPGQSPYDLVPYRETEFRLEGLTGFGLRFVLDDRGEVTGAKLIQPDAVYTLRRAQDTPSR